MKSLLFYFLTMHSSFLLSIDTRIVYDAEDSLRMDQMVHEQLVDDDYNKFRLWIWKEGKQFHLKIRSLREQFIALKFTQFLQNNSGNIARYSIIIPVGVGEYHYMRSKYYFDKGFYEGGIYPAEIYFHIYHFI